MEHLIILQDRDLALQLHLLVEPRYELLRLRVDYIFSVRPTFQTIIIAAAIHVVRVVNNVAFIVVVVVVVVEIGGWADARDAGTVHLETEGGGLVERQLPFAVVAEPAGVAAGEEALEPPPEGPALPGPKQGKPQQVPGSPSQCCFLLRHRRVPSWC